MKLFLDTANVEHIKEAHEMGVICGVTTNPSILAKSGGQTFEVLKALRSFIGTDTELNVQVVAKNAEGMVEDAHRIVKELGANTYVKVPSVPEGFKAMKILVKGNINITATAIYTPMQAFLAAKCGASYAAPYVNRIDNMGFNGIQVTKQIHDIFKNNNLKTEVLAASFKNSQQVLELCEYGIGASTIAPDIIEGFVKTQAITSAVDDFLKTF